MYKKAIAAAAFVFTSAAVHAQSADPKSGFYAGLDLGRSRLGVNADDIGGKRCAAGDHGDFAIADGVHGHRYKYLFLNEFLQYLSTAFENRQR